MTVEELEKQLKSFQSEFDITKKEFQVKLDSAKKETEEWKAIAEKKETEARQFQESAAKAEKERKAAEAQARENESKAFVESKIRDGKLLPAQREMAISLMRSLAAEGEVIASKDKDGATKAHSQLSLFKEIVSALPKRIEYGSFETKPGEEISAPLPGGSDEGETEGVVEVNRGGMKVKLPQTGMDLAAKAFVYQSEFRKKTGRDLDYGEAVIAVQQRERAGQI